MQRSTHNQDRSPIKGELWGTHGGCDWDYCPESGIVEITIIYSDAIDSLHFKHANENSTDKSSEKFGGCGGKNQQVSINLLINTHKLLDKCRMAPILVFIYLFIFMLTRKNV